MTVFTLAAPPAPPYTYVDGWNRSSPAMLAADSQPPGNFVEYSFPQTLVPLDGGKTLLRLRSAPRLRVDNRSRQFEVQDWGIQMPCSDVHDLPRQMARRFLDLFGKSERGMLSADERGAWITVLDQIDWTQFNIDRAAPHYAEGTLLRRQPTVVQWSDGVTEKLEPMVAPALQAFEPGELFSAFVKLGRDNKALSMERVLLIPPAGANARS
jgi:hypothetical protein